MRLNSRTDIEGPPVSSLNCDRNPVLAGHLKHTDTMPFKYYTYTPLLSTVVAHTLLNNAHIVGLRWGASLSADCGYNLGYRNTGHWSKGSLVRKVTDSKQGRINQ